MMSEGERKPSNAPAMPKEAQVMATILRDLGINGKIARYIGTVAIKFWGLGIIFSNAGINGIVPEGQGHDHCSQSTRH
jgi:hypothetical protein